MIALNLLSPIQKEALRNRVLFAMIERLMIFLTVAVLLLGIFLLMLRIRLTRTLGDVQSRQLLSTEYVSVNGEIRRLNEVITRIERVQREVTPASTLVIDVVGRVPPGVSIGNLAFETRTQSLRLNGQAANREALLTFEERLRASPYVKTLESPISNLFEKADINFTFQAVLDVEALKKTIEPAAPEAPPKAP